MTEFVEASPVARWSAVGTFAALLIGGLWLKHYADGLPTPTGTPEEALRVLSDRAFVAAAVATAFWSVLAAFFIWLATKSALSKQWPPPGVSMPRREKVREIKRPAFVWGVLALYVGCTAFLIATYWWQYIQLQDFVALVRE